MNDIKPVDLIQAFTYYNGNERFLENLVNILCHMDPAVAVLALEGLYRIESDVNSGQFQDLGVRIRDLLRRWRRTSPLGGAYKYIRVSSFLRSLTIFKTLKVPLFIDNYGQKKLFSNYTSAKSIQVDPQSTLIYHVTHKEEAQKILYEQKLKPNDAKNIIEGCWFGLDRPINSVYGSKSFETTFYKLGVTALHAGEIVSYKQEVNVILYAGEGKGPPFKMFGYIKPTDEAVREENPGAYVNVSIFVPSRFLPSVDNFKKVIFGPYDVEHGPFCVRAKRSGEPCEELLQAQLQARFSDL